MVCNSIRGSLSALNGDTVMQAKLKVLVHLTPEFLVLMIPGSNGL